MKTVRTVFLSSTARDLADYREKVFSSIDGLDGYACVRMEKFGARAWEASEFCRAKVLECDILVGIVGHLYGSSPAGSERSYTEIEYDAAAPEKRLMFMASEKFPLPADLRESDGQQARQRAFRDRVNQAGIRATFQNPDELAVEVLKSIRNWEGDTASRGVALLPELMRGPVRDAVVRSQIQFQTASKQIDVIASNKAMHDLLHELQFNCQDMLIVELQGFRPTVSPGLLERYETELVRITDKLRAIAGRPSLVGGDNSWIQTLADAQRELHAALEPSDVQVLTKHLTAAIERLGRVVSRQPSRINTVLNATVRALQLGDLVAVFARVREQLPRLGLDAGQVKAFEDGVDELTRLSDRLIQLTEAHDRWQEVEDQLRCVDGLLNGGLHHLPAAWPGLSETMQPLLADHAEFAELTRRLEAALDGHDDAAIRVAFRPFRSAAGRIFSHVDTELNELCRQLLKLNKPLNSVVDNLR